ncbi:MAG: transcription-repair coupling factor, partial [bacterium]|nr:transcription-repair coupling factor [bacterium]
MQQLEPSERFIKIVEALNPSSATVQVSGIWGSGKSYLISALWQQTSRPILIITPDEDTADAMTTDLQFFTGREILQFPSWEILPYEDIDPLVDLIAERMLVFEKIRNPIPASAGMTSPLRKQGQNPNPPPIVITSIKQLAQKVVPQEYLQNHTISLEFGESYELDHLLAQLVELGYDRVPMVEKRGEFAVRGGILDIFNISSINPNRCEFEGDSLSSLRYFDLVTQRSKTEIEQIRILPAKETSLIHRALDDKIPLVPLLDYFPETTLVVFDELLHIKQNLTQFEELIQERYTAACSLDEPQKSQIPNPKSQINSKFQIPNSSFETSTKVPTPEKLYAGLKELEEYIDPRVQLELSLLDSAVGAGLPCPTVGRGNLAPTPEHLSDTESATPQISHLASRSSFSFPMQSMESYRGQLDMFIGQLQKWQQEEYTIYIVCDNQGQLERLDELLKSKEIAAEVFDFKSEIRISKFETNPKSQIPNPKFEISPSFLASHISHLASVVYLTVGALHTGFAIPELKLALITDREIFSRYTRIRHFRRFHDGVPISSFIELTQGDYLVHEDYGIGKYLGIKKMEVDNREGDFLVLEYADGDKLYVPIEQINRVQKYIAGEGIVPKLNYLGDKGWERTKQRAIEAIQLMAKDLLELYGSRQVVSGHAYSTDTIWQREFEASFLFEETPDQLRAINEVKESMQEPKPMDRLLCGDVGYGKTEVAIRAAFKAVMDKKQVAVLVPTTILAEQHYHTFSERLADYPIIVEMLSRFKNPKQQKDIVSRIKLGAVDIVIGTHRLISKDIAFKELGLLIIDEEQRFGVRHKEKLKQLRKEVDVLTLTATPIPRTLYMSLSGIRDISIINTPPEDRLPIITYIHRFSDNVIREAILRELNRGGQVYFVHNRVQSIDAFTEYLRRLVPHARIAIGHGRLPEKELERVMLAFIAKQYDILVSTTIIESGLDIPNVNTIIINRADAFGLAQLYQLRGRVGRDRHQAYAYLLVPKEHGLTNIAEKRLHAIQEYTELGSGFRIAMRDLEIRGMGNLLGAQQSGHLEAIGFDLYCKMVEETINQLQGKPIPKRIETRLNLPVPAYFPATFISNERQKFWIYRKLAELQTEPELDETIAELKDRYGSFPTEAQILLDLVRLRLFAASLGISQLIYQDNQLSILFADTSDEITNFRQSFIKKHRSKIVSADTYSLVLDLPNI